MNIKVITRHAPSNYGSILQTVAMQEVIEQMGHSCEIIDYIRKDEYGFRGVLSALHMNTHWNSNPIKKVAYLMMRYPSERISEIRFAHIRKSYLHLTRRYHSIAELQDLDADVMMTGSDQVWNPATGFDPAYFLSFADDSCKKVSYAASFGSHDIPADMAEEYSRLLSRYTHITVREKRATEILKQLGINCEGEVLDPSLLLDADAWQRYINGSHDKHPSGRYVLTYQIHSDATFNQYAQQVARRLGMPLYRLSPSLHQISRGGRFIWLPSIGKFLSCFKHAAMVVTDSFHGTAFSINFNTPFVEYITNKPTASRNLNILQITGLQARIASSADDFTPIDTAIDFTYANNAIASRRRESIELLKHIIEN